VAASTLEESRSLEVELEAESRSLEAESRSLEAESIEELLLLPQV
jgi:hypothetical protein